MEIETPIIFVTSPIAAIERNGDDVTITTPPWTRTFHIVSVDRLSNKAYTLTRCGLPNRQVNVGVPLEQLRVLTPTGTNDVEFLEARAGVTDEQSCKNSLGGFKHWLTFDVFGPVHFYVQGEVGD